MIHVKEPVSGAPAAYNTPLQKQVYETLERLNIPYLRVENDEAVTMEDCLVIDEVLDVRIAKNLFLCNRQQTRFYLFATVEDKPFRSSDFSKALGVSRVSFAPEAALKEMLGTEMGAATMVSAPADPDKKVLFVIDEDLLEREYYGCPDGTTTGYIKLKTRDLTEKYLKYTNHDPVILAV